MEYEKRNTLTYDMMSSCSREILRVVVSIARVWRYLVHSTRTYECVTPPVPQLGVQSVRYCAGADKYLPTGVAATGRFISARLKLELRSSSGFLEFTHQEERVEHHVHGGRHYVARDAYGDLHLCFPRTTSIQLTPDGSPEVENNRYSHTAVR